MFLARLRRTICGRLRRAISARILFCGPAAHISPLIFLRICGASFPPIFWVRVRRAIFARLRRVKFSPFLLRACGAPYPPHPPSWPIGARQKTSSPRALVGRRGGRVVFFLRLLRVVLYCDRLSHHGMLVTAMPDNVALLKKRNRTRFLGKCRQMRPKGAITRNTFFKVF